MKTRFALATAFLAVAIALILYTSPGSDDRRAHADREAAKKEAMTPASISPSAVLSIRASQPSPALHVAPNAAVAPYSQEFGKARNLKPLYDRLTAPGGPTTGDAKFALYKIVATCARRTDAPPDPARPVQDTATRRRELEAMIPAASPDRDKRLALFDEINSRCAGLEGLTTTQADLDRMLAEAAQAGDPKAQVRLAFPAMLRQGNVSGNLTLSDDQFHTLQVAIASRDPEAIQIAGTMLSNTFNDAVLQVGPGHDELQNRASMEAWRLIACEYGLECGPGNPSLQTSCAFQGHCAATSIQDQTFYYGVSPYEAQLIDQYRQIFRNAVANNDWNGLSLSRQPNTSGSRFYFGSYP
jgi:hypothetical protein